MEKAELAARKSIIQASLSMNALGINQGTSGNVSVRYGDRLLITPSACPMRSWIQGPLRDPDQEGRQDLGGRAQPLQ